MAVAGRMTQQAVDRTDVAHRAAAVHMLAAAAGRMLVADWVVAGTAVVHMLAAADTAAERAAAVAVVHKPVAEVVLHTDSHSWYSGWKKRPWHSEHTIS